MGIETFGTTDSGIEVKRITLVAGDLTVSVLTLGAILQSVRLNGVAHDLTLGSEKLADYVGPMRSHGSLIGPVVNRFTHAAASIGGKLHHFEKNLLGQHTLHSGACCTRAKHWAIAAVDESSVTLAVDLPDGEGGFPGNRHVTCRFTVEAPASLRMEVTTTTDALTLVNFANHSYWNLDGTTTWAGHSLRVAADRRLPTTDFFAPTGEIADVAGTPWDLRAARRITPGNPDFDTNYCLSESRVALRDVLRLTGGNGVTMTVATTEPGIQVYDARNAARPGGPYYEGLAIEAQNWPDAPNHAGFPSIEVGPDAPCVQVTEWRFAKD